MTLSDNPNELLLQVSLSDRQAFKQLYDLTSAKLFAISLRITKQESLSEEVLQDSFVKIWENAKRFDPNKAQAITWMGTIVRNQSIDAIRKNAKFDMADTETAAAEDVVSSEFIEDNPEQLALHHSEMGIVNKCLQALNDKQQSVILLAYVEGYAYQEIATMKSVPVGSVKTWIHRGIAGLKQCIKQNNND